MRALAALFRRSAGVPLVLVAPALLTGCGGSGREETFPARGRVVLDGKPPVHALVVLHPLDGNGRQDRPRPHGKVAEDGTFVLTTYEPGDGAPRGEYAVTVEWWLASKGRGGDDPPPSNRLPARYARPQTSGLRAVVSEGENDLPEIRIKPR
jgi:hypothetical protein